MGSVFSKPKPPPMPAPVALPPPPPPPPEIEPPPVAPIPDDQKVKTDAEKKSALAAKRSGRASTIFEDDDGKLG